MNNSQPSNTSNEIHIEVCQNCRLHRWCTRHDEKKYNLLFETLAKAINKDLGSNYQVFKNKNVDKPRIGAFEVVFKGETVFSKIKSGFFPTNSLVVSKIKDIIEGKKQENKNEEEKTEKTNENNKPQKKKLVISKPGHPNDAEYKIPKYDIICPSPTKIHRAYKNNDSFNIAVSQNEQEEKKI